MNRYKNSILKFYDFYRFIGLLPLGKKEKYLKDINNYWDKETNYDKFDNFINFKINFLKLANPKINYNLEKDIKFENKLDENINNDNFDFKTFLINYLQENGNNTPNQEKKLDVEYINLNEDDSIGNRSGTYIMKNGKLQKGKGEERVTINYSNWHGGNTDPDDLKKHKELLDRQNFRGPFWKDKEIPKFAIMDPHLQANYHSQIKEEDSLYYNENPVNNDFININN